jgi:hypothetical protein
MRLSIIGSLVVWMGGASLVVAQQAVPRDYQQPGSPTVQEGQLQTDNATHQSNSPRLPQQAHGWWTDPTAGWIGGIGGSVFGLLGGLLGTLGSLGKARRFVLTLTAALAGLGVMSLVVGVIAVALGQPYAVYYPLLLLGVILAAVCGGNLPSLRRRYEQIELHKMAAMDTR